MRKVTGQVLSLGELHCRPVTVWIQILLLQQKKYLSDVSVLYVMLWNGLTILGMKFKKKSKKVICSGITSRNWKKSYVPQLLVEWIGFLYNYPMLIIIKINKNIWSDFALSHSYHLIRFCIYGYIYCCNISIFSSRASYNAKSLDFFHLVFWNILLCLWKTVRLVHMIELIVHMTKVASGYTYSKYVIKNVGHTFL